MFDYYRYAKPIFDGLLMGAAIFVVTSISFSLGELIAERKAIAVIQTEHQTLYKYKLNDEVYHFIVDEETGKIEPYIMVK